MPYIGTSPTQGVRVRYIYTATSSQTAFSGADANGVTLRYQDEEYVDVYKNGLILKTGTDYTLSNNTTMTLASGASNGDKIAIIVYDVFNVTVDDAYTKSTADSRFLNVAGDTMSGALDLNGVELVLDADADTSITADTDDQIDIKIAGADDFRFTANTFTALSGSTIAAQALTATTIAVSNDGTIGSTGDADAIAISSSGVVTFSQSPVFPDGSINVADIDLDGATDIGAALADADLFLIDDGAGGTMRKATASRVKTYMGASAGAFSVENLDIDGSTDIGEALVDADLFIVDNGAGGTNRKMAASRILTYVGASAGAFSLANLDIDGGTDIGAGLADADLLIVDDGAGGTNRKTAMSRVKTYVSDLTLTTAAQTNITSLGTLSALTVDDVAIDGKVITMTGSSSDTAVITAGTDGTLSIVTTDDSAAAANITITADGTFEADGTTITLDSSGDIVLDADGADVIFKDDGTSILSFTNSSSDAVITAGVQDKDIIFKGDDGGSAVTSLTLDMSNSGAAAFSAAAYNAEATLTDASTISWNAITQPVAKVTLGANRTLGAASGGIAGAFISLLIIQDGTGSRTVTFNAAYEFKDDTAPTLTSTASKGDLFVFRYNGSKWLEVGRNTGLTLS